MTNNNLRQLLHTALDMEKKGYKFYKEISQKSQNEVTKKIFDFLAKDEVLHIEKINDFYIGLDDQGDMAPLSLEDIQKHREERFDIFSKSISEIKMKIKPDDDDKKAYEVALEMENNGYKYYENMLKEAQDKTLVKFIQFLVEEEKKHYKLILNTYEYLNDSDNWFMYEEGIFPQGG